MGILFGACEQREHMCSRRKKCNFETLYLVEGKMGSSEGRGVIVHFLFSSNSTKELLVIALSGILFRRRYKKRICNMNLVTPSYPRTFYLLYIYLFIISPCGGG
jgi:hypothetical protein